MTTNDPKNRVVKLEVATTVEVVLAFKPDRINFGRLEKSAGSPASKFVQLIGTEKDNVKLVSAKSNNERIKVEISQKGFENQPKKQVKISVLPGIKVGRFRDTIVVKTDHKKLKKLSINVYGEVVGNVIVAPNRLSYGLLRPGSSRDKVIMVKAASDRKTIRVLEVKSTIPELKVRMETIKEGKQYKVTATLDENFDKDVLTGSLIIRTDDPEQGEIEVKVFGRARKARGPQKSPKGAKK